MRTNHVELTGVIGFDPEIREIAKGRLVARMSIGTVSTHPGIGDVDVTDTQWHAVVAWGTLADRVLKEIKKGMPVNLVGRLVYRSYHTKDGSRRYVTEIVMSDFTIMKPATTHETEQGPTSQQ